ncbi:lysophospholipid acyltransferase family protein [Flammeovirga kamogawensis]|uniref:Lipid A biosynthesis lauroyl acyltransferase n=1 Tax=Flammeovirga kamogawensis TaxID=373891 RepID=A0ABX8GXR5_9BACT|nr:lipid A biosynthesis lauroyl acyltransferase [Flammeovirga kamogawensis]MBB6460637.1 KDO2-lipid IV(A) lauroyltransferase [Flammeovirga kamogawensis]QWG07992.1 lipid A biosynthesis lauroyl acyltransferase [Flammeovirga kamogawensis]TRX69799.1 lipid A biosynthesis lauroyl acyltransferase [Flammeovirga kamogawensis]
MSQRKGWKKLKYELLYWALKGLLIVAGWVPRSLLMWFFKNLAGIAYYIMPKTRDLSIEHLKYAYGDEMTDEKAKKMTKNIFKNLGKNFTDVIRYPTMNNVDDILKVLEVEGEEHLLEAYDKGKGVILLTCHRGAFDMVGYYLNLKKYSCIAVGAKLQDPKLNELLVNNRRNNRHELSDFVERSDPRGSIKMFKKLKDGGLAFLLIDQDTDKVQNTFVDFYGKQAATPIGAAVLALKADAAIIPAAVKMQPNGKHMLTFKPEVPLVKTGDLKKDINVNTQNMSLALEEFIKEEPEQWVWFHERWKTKPSQDVSK